MRNYAELRADRGYPISKHEYFKAALHFVGSIKDCDIPKLREAAIEMGMESVPPEIRTVAANHNCEEITVQEMWIRIELHRDLEHILAGGGLQEQDLQNLKEFVFQLLYPLPQDK